MQMGTGSAPSAATQSDELAFVDTVSFFDAHHGQVQVEREQSLTVVGHDAVALEVERTGQNYSATVDRRDESAGGNAEIESPMRTLDGTVENALHSEDVRNIGGDAALERSLPLPPGGRSFEGVRLQLFFVWSDFQLFRTVPGQTAPGFW